MSSIIRVKYKAENTGPGHKIIHPPSLSSIDVCSRSLAIPEVVFELALLVTDRRGVSVRPGS